MDDDTDIDEILFIEPTDVDFSGLMELDWITLTYRQDHIHFPVWLLSRLPNLVTLRLDLWSVQLTYLLTTVNHLTCLRDLSIEISYSDTLPDLPLETITPCPSLCTLSILESYGPLYDITDYLIRFVKLLVKTFGNVDEFAIQGQGIGSAYIAINSDGFQKLKGLDLISIIPLSEGKAWFPPSLRELSVNSQDFMFTQLYSPSLEYLNLSLDRSDDIKQELSLEGWPKLQKLIIDVANISLRNAIHQNLRDIQLKSSFPDDLPDTSYTSFCRDVALYPSNLPSLRSIELGQIPEWDILFLMLEHKNFCREPGVVRIARIDLPDSCPERLLRPLRHLLGGVYTERPSNLDLSVVGNEDIIFDTSMSVHISSIPCHLSHSLHSPGCIACHRALRLCKLECDAARSLEKAILTPPLYPDNPREILLTWDERAAWWEDVSGSGFGRKESCYRHSKSQSRWIAAYEEDEYVESPWI